MPAPKPPEFYTKTGLHVEPAPSNEELWATGLVAYLWNIYANHITEYGMALTRADPAARKVFLETIGLKQRTRLVRELIRRYAKPEYQKQWTDLINRGGSLQIQRDKIIHGDWGYTLANNARRPALPIRSLPNQRKIRVEIRLRNDFSSSQANRQANSRLHDFQIRIDGA